MHTLYFFKTDTLSRRLNMLKYTLKVLIPLTIIFLVSCAPKGISPVPKSIMADLDEVRSLTKTELADNQKIQNDYNLKQELLKKIGVEDVAEKKELFKEKGVVEKAKKELSQLTEKILKKRQKKLLKAEVEKIVESLKEGVTEKEIVELLEKVASGEISEEEATAILRKKTKLSEEGIKKLVAKTKKIQKETEELAEKLATASADEVAEILKEAGGVSKRDILALVEKKKQVDAIESSFLEKTMSKLYTRLVRDKELGIEEGFCINIEGILDHLLVEPSYFDTDKFSIDEYIGQIESSFRLLEPVLEQYPEIVVRLEGNADERGTVEYNKALSDRRWETPSRVLIALYFDEDRTAGVGRSEQCPLPRAGGITTRDWWSSNRRTDYIFKLK
jgi:outer membrane protein OmpA-like peptidoglycan-associated protein